MAPTLIYFPVAGRGQLCRLIAKLGGIEDFVEQTSLPEGVTKADCGSGGSVPLLVDGDLKMNESTAIEYYLMSIAPKYADLTPKQKGRDAQFCAIKEDFLSAVCKPLFGGKDKDGINACVDKMLPLIEGILPADGFINGLDFPTVADLAVLNIVEGYMPFGAAYKHGEVDVATRFPKLFAHSEMVKAVEDVATALEATPLKTAAFGM
mmetsp:Transcript_15382/g.27812  ORF Transcript_15382/g.27812 Transcript_15382/m.27812 type:complete len:207 (+) Transcript_15382:106-726(+)